MSKVKRVTELPELLPRKREAHKGDFGCVLVVGGSQGMPGAVALASNAALRGGAGLVTFAAPRAVQLTIAGMVPCATSVPLSCDADGLLTDTAVAEVSAAAEKVDVLAVGPGLAIGGPQTNLVRAMIAQDKPLVLDADGLNNLARIAGWSSRRTCPLVLTPHPGEFARLTGRSIFEIQADRESVALTAVREWGDVRTEEAPPLVLVLKGAGTIVTDGRRVFVNETGNPGMATGGAGDVLTGLTAALLAQGLEPFDAARMAVAVHGRAGDLAAMEFGEASLIATDLLDWLGEALVELTADGE